MRGGYRKQKLALVAGVVLSAGLALTGCDLSEELQKDKNESGDSSQSFSITFDYGNDIKTTHKYTSNDTYKPDIPQKKGYDFKGWYLGDSETPFSFENLDLDKDLTLTAVYTPTVYNVKFELNGGTGAGSLTYTIESDKVVLPTPKRNGYNFDGWYETENISEESKIVEEILQGSTGDKTFYAKWTAKSYTITYNLNDGTPAIGSSYTIEDNITLPTPTRKGYTFDGWYETENITDESKSVEKILQGSTGNRVFYAKWSLIEYAITYELNGGEFAGSAVKSYTIESDRIDLPTNVTRAGYTFDGWLLNGSDATAIEKGSTGDKTFYAKWDLITYTITYNLNDGTLAEDAVKLYTVESEDISLQTPTRAGYIFDGWYINENFSGSSVTKISSGSTGNKVLYAKWTKTITKTEFCDFVFADTTDNSFVIDSTVGGFEGAGVSIQYVDPETDGQGGIVKCIKRDYKYYVDANGVVYQSIIVSEIDAENNVTTTLMGYIVGDDVYKKVDGGYEKGSKSDTTNKVVDEINEVLSRGNYLETDYISSLEERVNSADFDSDSDGVMEYTCSTENSMKVYTIIWTPTVGSEKQMKFVYNGNNIVKFHCVEVESGKEYPYPCVEKFSSIEELNLPDFANETITNSTT